MAGTGADADTNADATAVAFAIPGALAGALGGAETGVLAGTPAAAPAMPMATTGTPAGVQLDGNGTRTVHEQAATRFHRKAPSAR